MFGLYRFVLAFNVVLFHILSVPQIGPLAVYSFFILSGYLMTLIMHQTYGYSIDGIKKYAMNRFFRLYPVYWALILITLVMISITGENYFSTFHNKMQLPSTITEVFSNISMIYPEIKPNSYAVRLAPASWALTIELFFYFLIGLGISKTKQRTIVWFILSLSYLLYNNIILKNYGFSYGDYITASLPFSIGALLFFYKDSLSNFIKKITYGYMNLPVCTSLFLLNLIICSTASFQSLIESWKINLICTGLNLLFSALMVIKLSNVKSHNLTFRALDKFTGDLSYPIYLFHWAGACFASWIIATSPPKNTAIFLLGITLTLIISIIVNLLINDKVELIRKKIKNTQTASN